MNDINRRNSAFRHAHTITVAILLLFATTAKPQSYEQLADAAADSIRGGNLKAAEQLIKKAIETSPNDPHNALLFSNLGSILWQMDKKQDAAEAYSTALNFMPLSVPILTNRGKLYIELGDIDKALTDFNTLLDVNKTDSMALFFRAYIYQKKGMLKEAEKDYAALLSQTPKDKKVRLGLAITYGKEENFKASLDMLHSLIRDFPNDYDIIMARAHIYFDMQHNDLAWADAELATSIIPSSPYPPLLMGDIQMRRNNTKSAKNYYEKAIENGLSAEELGDRMPTLRKRYK